jgi:hypothetical protein
MSGEMPDDRIEEGRIAVFSEKSLRNWLGEEKDEGWAYQ